MPTKNRNLILAVSSLAIIVAIVYGYWNFVYQPLKMKIDTATQEVATLTSKLAAAEARAGQLHQLQAEMQSLQVDVAQLERQLPKSKELPGLIRVFTHRAESYGLTRATFAPQKAVPKG